MSRSLLHGKTRKQVAENLLKLLKRGPQYSGTLDFTPERAMREYKGWAESWVLTELCRIIPELKSHLDSLGYYDVRRNDEAL